MSKISDDRRNHVYRGSLCFVEISDHFPTRIQGSSKQSHGRAAPSFHHSAAKFLNQIPLQPRNSPTIFTFKEIFTGTFCTSNCSNSTALGRATLSYFYRNAFSSFFV